MRNVNLKIVDVLTLEKEINGFTNQETGNVEFKGLLKMNLPIILKYELRELSSKLSKEKESVEELKRELILKFGEKNENEQYFLNFYNEITDEGSEEPKRVINPNFLEFEKEFGGLLSTEIEVEVPTITKDVLKNCGETTDNYSVLFDIITK